MSAPLGQYDSSGLLNIGTNRWSISRSSGLQGPGAVDVELDAGVTFYLDNDDLLNRMTLEQDPIYAVQGHLIYNFGAGYGARWTPPTTPAGVRPSMV